MPAHALAPAILGPIVKHALRCTPAEAALVDAVLEGDPLPLHDAVQALTAAGLRLSMCRRYHLHKAVVRPALPPPAVARRWMDSLTVNLRAYHPLFDVPVTHLVLTRDGREVARVAMEAPPAYAPAAAVTVAMVGLTPGTPYTLQSSCVVDSDPDLQASLVLGDPVVVHTLSPPGPPPAPAVVERGPTHLCVRVMDVGTACDPASSGVVLEVDGVVWGGPCEALPDHGLLFRVEGLGEGTRHALRCRCAVAGDAEVDAGLPWSLPTVATTDLSNEVCSSRTHLLSAAFAKGFSWGMLT